MVSPNSMLEDYNISSSYHGASHYGSDAETISQEDLTNESQLLDEEDEDNSSEFSPCLLTVEPTEMWL